MQYKYLWLCALVVWTVVGRARGECPSSALAPLSFVLEFAVWRGWHQTLIYVPDLEPGCNWAVMRLAKCLSVNGVGAAMSRDQGVARMRSRLGLTILTPPLGSSNATRSTRKIIKHLTEQQMNTDAYDWLIATQSSLDIKYINEILNSSSMRFDQNIIVGYPFYKYRKSVDSLGLCVNNFIYKNKRKNDNGLSRRRNSNRSHRYYDAKEKCRRGTWDKNCRTTEYETNYYRTTDRYRNLTRNQTYKKSGSVIPIFLGGVLSYNYSRAFEMTNVSKFSLRPHYNKWIKDNRFYGISQGTHVVQYFKVRHNSTLYAHFLGNWDREQSMSRVDPPYPTEARNFLGEDMVVGRCNSSGDSAPALDDDGPSAPESLDDVLHFLTVRMNTTSVTRYYTKLGFRTYEGLWTGLLGALMDGSVDLALEPVTAHAARHNDMNFIFPIAETMCNIYIRHQETSTVRDIFLAPFSASLVACVVAVAAAAALALVLVSRLAPPRQGRRPLSYTEALIWSTGILCQQGDTWTPPSPSASVLLIACLLFAVVTYNAYAAFITSVLSVRVASLDTVAAVLHSPTFKIGYIRNGADQMYLMSTKDAQLNAIYIRGYSNAENLVSSAEEGLARAASQDFAFFAGQRAARSTLRSLSQARGRCAVRELPVHSTRAQLAFPLPSRSPYARPMLVSLLQLRGGGALARLEAALVPGMPQCAPPPGFASARAADVRSALLLLVVGLVAAAVLGIGEYCWKNRRQLIEYLVKSYRRVVQVIQW